AKHAAPSGRRLLTSTFGHTRDAPLPRPPQIKRTSTFTSRLRVSYPLTRIAPADARLRTMASEDLQELVVTDASAWLEWLGEHHAEQRGVWLVLAKKGTSEPTSLSYDEALEHALCHGWIDGQVRRRDEGTFRQRFTPRRARSAWSRRNVGIVERL